MYVNNFPKVETWQLEQQPCGHKSSMLSLHHQTTPVYPLSVILIPVFTINVWTLPAPDHKHECGRHKSS